MDRATIAKFWNDAWGEGLWAAAWEKSVADLTPEQAAWQPAPDRHSIWQIVLHMVFWRENELRRSTSGRKPTDDEIRRHNFPAPSDVTPAAWDEARRRLRETQQRVAALLAEEGAGIERIAYLLPHDCYHFGQINYIRAMLNLRAVE